ncbi:DUF1389 domain-containing protein [Chlamydia psittaci]|uniref:DUF1389 domain-containing protein n=1 Tax=Chlamydia psittaci TaxID=83554 RepID=UPI00027E1DF1|nr:DUF1389 domain-containing protein [Chlamydia psittaci]AFS24611.1 hypothetical protein B602_0611 [Chlamydia psittaci M56]
MHLYFFTSVSFSPQYIEKKVSSGQPVHLEKIIERVGSFLHICGPEIQVTDLSEGRFLYYRVVKSEFSCMQSCMKILAYLLVVPVIVALVVKLIAHILLFHKYQLIRDRREEDHSCHEIPQHPVQVPPPPTLVNEQAEGTRERHTVISADLLAIFLDNFPAVIGEILVEQHLSFEEFQSFINKLRHIQSSLSLNTLPLSLKEKLARFGISRIAELFNGRDIESLSLIQQKFQDVLLSFCPFLWLSKFCDACTQNRRFFLTSPVPREAYRSRASLSAYWVSRLAFSDETLTIFSPVFWVLSEIISSREYEHLCYYASVVDGWDKNKEIVSSLFVRYCQYISHSRESQLRNLNITKELFSKYLLLLANHGFSLNGLRLLRSLTLEQVLTLQDLTAGSHGNRLSRWMKSFGNLIYKDGLLNNPNKSFSQALQLLTWSELREHGVNQSDATFSLYLSEICDHPIVISDPVVCEAEKQVRKFNLDTGECILTLESRASGSPALQWTNWARSVHSKYS